MSTKVNRQVLSASSVSNWCLTPITCVVIPPDEIAEHPERPDHQPASEWDSCPECPGKVLWHPQAANGWVGEAELATLRWKGKKHIAYLACHSRISRIPPIASWAWVIRSPMSSRRRLMKSGRSLPDSKHLKYLWMKDPNQCREGHRDPELTEN